MVTMITNGMSILEVFRAADKPLNTATQQEFADIIKASKVYERRRTEWLVKNPEKTCDDFYDEWYPGGHKAYYEYILREQLKVVLS